MHKKEVVWSLHLFTWVISSKDDISNGVATFTARVPSPKDGTDLGVLVREGDVDAASRQDDQDDRVL